MTTENSKVDYLPPLVESLTRDELLAEITQLRCENARLSGMIARVETVVEYLSEGGYPEENAAAEKIEAALYPR